MKVVQQGDGVGASGVHVPMKPDDTYTIVGGPFGAFVYLPVISAIITGFWLCVAA